MVFLSSTLYALCIETKRNFVNQNKGKITLIRKIKFNYELMFWFISIENNDKQKNTKYLESRNQSLLSVMVNAIP